MNSLILLAVAVGLFAASFLSKRRFGLLGLGLAAGAMLNDIWGNAILNFVLSHGSPLGDYTSVVVASAVILLPSIALLFHGYTYDSKLSRGISSALFAALALAFLIQPFGQISGLSGTSLTIYNLFVDQKTLIVGATLAIAVVDIFLTKPSKG